MIKISYIRVQQRSEVFFITKMKLNFLLEHLNFHYRDPYNKLESRKDIIRNQRYIDAIMKKGIDLQASDEGVQRRLQISRINSIKEFIESDVTNFLPNSVLLSADVSDLDYFEDEYLNYEEKEIGKFEFPDNFAFSIIDGQHRLAGLSLINNELKEELEIPAIILFNVSKPTAAKLFADINGKQKAVNKSLIYDLYSELDTEDFEKIRKFHTICENFYKKRKSPLFRQIKMLGIGSGAISQAFFIDYVKDAIEQTRLRNKSSQSIFDQLFYYFQAFQITFPDDWPVPIEFDTIEELDDHAKYVLKMQKSQLVKTNGFGAIIRAFPTIFEEVDGDTDLYLKIIKKLKGRINWIPDEVTGTGKAFQNSILSKILKTLDIK